MLGFLAISVIFIVIGSAVSDKIEKKTDKKENNDSSKKEDVIDIETLRILNDYGLIDSENYKNNFSDFNKA